jgi:hypothetical protein
MSSSSSSIIRSAIERAKSRASVLNSLEKSYGKTQQSKAIEKEKLPTPNPETSSHGLLTSCQFIQNFIGDQREKAKKVLSDSLFGKSIVLSNSKSQHDATKSAKRVKNALKRQSAQRASKTKLKKLNPLLCDPLSPPTAEDMAVLNTLWNIYVSSILAGAQSEAQLQARLIISELVGAEVIIVESGTEKRAGKDKGLRGILTAVSKQCYYISYKSKKVDSSINSSSSNINSEITVSNDIIDISNNNTKKRVYVDNNDDNSSAVIIDPSIHDDDMDTHISNNLKHELNDNIFQSMISTIKTTSSSSNNKKNKSDLIKTLKWIDCIKVRRVEKDTSVLAILLPPLVSKKEGKKLGGVIGGESKEGRICLLHGAKHMPYTNSKVKGK